MSTRSERAERKNSLSGVTGCNYGAHPFERRNLPQHLQGKGLAETHMHYCPDCGAEYFASDPCWCSYLEIRIRIEGVTSGRHWVEWSSQLNGRFQAEESMARLRERIANPPARGYRPRILNIRLDTRRTSPWHEGETEGEPYGPHQSDAGEPEHGQQQPPTDPPD